VIGNTRRPEVPTWWLTARSQSSLQLAACFRSLITLAMPVNRRFPPPQPVAETDGHILEGYIDPSVMPVT